MERKKKKRKVKVKRLLLLIAIVVIILTAIVGVINFIAKLFSPEKVAGNYANTGLAIKDGNVVYYNKYENGIFKIKGNKETQITSETAYSITLVKNTIYYLTISENNTIDLKSVNKNGENQKKIATLSTPFSKFYIEDNNVIYVTNKEKMKIVKISLDNLEEKTIVETGVQDFVVSNGKIYYSNNEGHLYSIGIEGNDAKEIWGEDNVRNFQVLDKWIYFYDVKENALCKIKSNGKSKQTVSSFITNETYNVTSKKIYYFDSANKQICSCDLKGKKSVAIAKIGAERTRLNIVNGIIYYLDNSKNENQIYQMYRVKTNGEATNPIDY